MFDFTVGDKVAFAKDILLLPGDLNITSVGHGIEFSAHTVGDSQVANYVQSIKANVLEILIMRYHHTLRNSEAAEVAIVGGVKCLAGKLGQKINSKFKITTKKYRFLLATRQKANKFAFLRSFRSVG